MTDPASTETSTLSLHGRSSDLANGDNGDDWDNFVYKVDHRLTEKDNLSVFLLKRDEVSTNPFSGSPLGLFASTTTDRKSTRLNSSHSQTSYAVFCLKTKKPRDA